MTVLYCGWNGFGQLRGTWSAAVYQLTPILSDEPIANVSCSWSTLGTVTISGESVVTGFVKSQPKAVVKLQLPSGDRVKQVSTCQSHTLIVSSSGTCWRHSSDENSLQPVLDFTCIERDMGADEQNRDADSIIKVCCSNFINLALSKSGFVYTIPSLVAMPGVRVTDVACGNSHNIMLTDRGSVYTWGIGSRGQLGHGDLNTEENPREVEALGGLNVRTVSCGSWHCAAVTHDGFLYTWGWDSFGQLGVRNMEDGSLSKHVKKKRRHSADYGELLNLNYDVSLILQLRPELNTNSSKIKADKETSEGCSESSLHSSSLEVEDKMNNPEEFPTSVQNICDNSAITISQDSGPFKGCQLQALPVPVESPHNILAVSCGARHTAVLLDDGSVWGCGWNRYGQLGVPPSVCRQINFLQPIPLPPSYACGRARRVVCGGWSTCIFI